MAYHRSSSQRRRSRRWWAPLAGGVVAAAIAATIAYGLHRQSGSNAAGRDPAPASLVAALSHIPPAVWEAAGVEGAPRPQVLASPATAPNLLYIGAEGCPYCAAERWVLTVALARFGTFSGLSLTTSASNDVYPNTPTLSFYGASYRSPYLHVQLMEIAGRQLGPNGFGPPLMRLSPAQQRLFQRYDAPPYVPPNDVGSIPFVLVGGRYLWIGSPELPQTLHGQSWSQIADQIARGQGAVGQSVLRNANRLTAALCLSDGQRPASVCRTPVIQTAERGLAGP